MCEEDENSQNFCLHIDDDNMNEGNQSMQKADGIYAFRIIGSPQALTNPTERPPLALRTPQTFFDH